MKKYQKFLVIAVIVLALFNLFLMSVVWRGHRNLHTNTHIMHPLQEQKLHRQMDVLDQRLNLDERQREVFSKAFKEHREAMLEIDAREKRIRREFHRVVLEDDRIKIDSIRKETLLLTEERNQVQMALVTEIARTCRPDQREAMLNLLSKLSEPPHDRPMLRRRKHGNH